MSRIISSLPEVVGIPGWEEVRGKCCCSCSRISRELSFTGVSLSLSRSAFSEEVAVLGPLGDSSRRRVFWVCVVMYSDTVAAACRDFRALCATFCTSWIWGEGDCRIFSNCSLIKAASTKPFGYMPFYPGPGLGGHCIPIPDLESS